MIPSLNGSRNRVQNDHKVQHARVLPPLRLLHVQGLALILAELLNGSVSLWVLGGEGAPLEEIQVLLGEVVVGDELLDVGEELRLRDADERVPDPSGAARSVTRSGARFKQRP